MMFNQEFRHWYTFSNMDHLGSQRNKEDTTSEARPPVGKKRILVILCVLIWTFVCLENHVTINIQRQTGRIVRAVRHDHEEWTNLSSYLHPSYCDVNCTTGLPCSYLDELDLRIILMTFDRPESLKKCLDLIHNLDTLGDKVGLDIWIDRSLEGQIDEATLNVSHDFQKRWKRGRTCVHQQIRNANIMGQWIDTWRPRENTSELALILEDDIDVSPLAYKWIKHMHGYFHRWTKISGYTLQMENVFFIGKHNQTGASAPKSDLVYLMPVFGTWGFAPFPKHWRAFQDWFHMKRQDKNFHPYVEGITMTDSYKFYQKQGTQDSLWDLWAMYYFAMNNLFVVRPNLQKFCGRMDVLLDTNRLELGLHFHRKRNKNHTHLLLREWEAKFDTFPKNITRYDFFGRLLNS